MTNTCRSILTGKNLIRNIEISYSEVMRDTKNGIESQQLQLEHVLLMGPSISDGQHKPTSFPTLFPRLKWFKAEIVSDL